MENFVNSHRVILEKIADRAMLERGLLPYFSKAAQQELSRIQAPARPSGAHPPQDLRKLLWCSIDNDDSQDLDQLTIAEAMPGGQVKLRVAVADVDALVNKDTAIDADAQHNTTSVYTAAKIYPMLPEKLSTDLTSLEYNADRLAVVVEMVVSQDGSIQDAGISPAVVHNYAKLAYNRVAAWLEGEAPPPEAVTAIPGLAENLKLQDAATQRMQGYRHTQGALSLETIQAQPTFSGDELSGLEEEKKNRARDIIEDFMIGANGVTARYLEKKGFPSIRRVVRSPERWERIVELAAAHGTQLPRDPDSKGLEAFLVRQKKLDPLRFPDLSLAIIKLLGSGEYVAGFPGEEPPGHFGLAVRDYSHSTAPNRRYSDLITQRLLKAALQGQPVPYTRQELEDLAAHCTEQEDAANKVERQVTKSAAALLLQGRIGAHFDAIVTGAAPKGTWVRVLGLPVEGKLVQGFAGLDVGDRLRVQLISVDVEQGFIDFRRINHE